MKFAYSAECYFDEMRLVNAILERKLKFRFDTAQTLLSEGTVIDVNCSLTDLREIMEEIVDGHYMVQSVNTFSEFTGERYYFPE